MRLVIAAIIWIIFIGGLSVYMQARESVEMAPDKTLQTAMGKFTIRVTTTFAPVPDPFALKTLEQSSSSLTVKLHGVKVLGPDSQPDADEFLFRADLPQLLAGRNEFYVEAYPDLRAASKANALRVEIMKDGVVLTDRTFWSEPGERIAGTLTTTVH
ncbi:MAG: hypothetical protein QG577_2154 [Thermodesulfobacteriota bacterium]|nr:hypothetical protein [Thermodesulfobacteriota bacterium]